MKLKRIHLQILMIFVIFTLLLFTNQRTFYWDSEYYFQLAENFDFMTFNTGLRGYFFPFFIHCILKISNLINGDYIYFWWFVISILYGLSFFTVIPNFFENIFNLIFNSIERIIFTLTILFFWHGLIIYPLTDVPAICCLSFGIFLLLISEKNKFRCLLYLLSGVFITISYYLRPVYLASLILVILLLIVELHKKKNYLQVLCFIIGFFIISFPQAIINKRTFDTTSPFIQAVYSIEEKNEDLYLKQLFWGISINRAEGNINLTKYDKDAVLFIDPIGDTIIKSNENLTINYRNYIKIICKYPLEMTVIYSKHIFSGIDHVFAETYSEDIYKNRILFSMINYSFWFLGILGILKIIPKSQSQKCFYFLIYIAPVLLAIPTAIETRFFLPLYLMIYFIAIYSISGFMQKSISEKKNIFKKYFLNFLLFIIICFILSSYSFINISDANIIFNNF